MRARNGGMNLGGLTYEGGTVWYVFGGFAALIYLTVLFTLGLTTLRKGHWVMFILGIFLPLFWLIGALMPPASAQPA